MRILMVNKFLYPNGGSETYIFKIGEYLNANGHEVQFFGMEHEGRIVGNHAESYTSDMDFHTGKLKKLLYPFKIVYSFEARKKIKAVLEDFKPDVVHLNNFNFQITPSILYEIKKFAKSSHKKIPIIYTAHDYQLVCPNHMMIRPLTKEKCSRCVGGHFKECTKGRCIHKSFAKSILGSVEGYLYSMLGSYQYLDLIICPSYFMEGQLIKSSILKGKTKVLHNFIDATRNGSEDSLDFAKKQDYVICFGRYSEEKGITTLLEVCKQLPQISFVFAGNGPLEEAVNALPNIKNEGFQTGEKLKNMIQKARFAVIASEWYENCPFSVMEAQIYQTPVIGADIGGIPELIQNGKTGLLFESGNQEELKSQILRLWNYKEENEEFIHNCRQVSFDTTAEYCEKLLALYQQEV